MMKHTLLCVDDEQYNLDALYRALRREYHVLTATSGKEGLELLQQHDVTLVITDQRMPEMTGIEFLKATLQIQPELPRIILTGYTEVHDLIDAVNQANVYRYITKPWETNDLTMTIAHAIQTMELTQENRRLFEDTIRLEKLATVGQVASGIAHEVKNQLTVLMGVELIQQQHPDDDFIQEMGNHILHARKRIVTLLDEIKSYSKQSGRELVLSPVSVKDLIQSTKDIVELDPEVKGTKIVVQSEREDRVLCDKDRIVQVLINFIRNAAHAMDGQGTITILTRSDGGQAAVSVRDQGCGIAEENRDKIWQPFFTTKEDLGTGLGLAICKKIVESHGGKIYCVSLADQGTTFTITLPLANENPPPSSV